jgi:hypothetical protein
VTTKRAIHYVTREGLTVIDGKLKIVIRESYCYSLFDSRGSHALLE